MSASSEPYPSLIYAENILTRYGYFIMLIFGVLGNIFNICIFLRKTLRITSCNNYFLASAFTNLVALIVGITPALYVYDRPWVITEFYCKARGYILNSSQQMSRFFIVVACFDHYARCSKNVQLQKFCRVHIARRYVIPSIIFVWLIIPVHIFIFPIIVIKTCVFIGSGAFYNSIYGIFWAGFLPPSLMLFFSLLTFHNFTLRQKRHPQIHPLVAISINLPSRRNGKKEIKERHILVMLLVQVFVHVTSATLYTSNLFYSVITTNNGINKTIERRAIEAFISFITEMLRFLSPVLSFYLFMFISRLFRKQIKLMLFYICCHCFSSKTKNRINNDDIALKHLTTLQNRHKQQPTSMRCIITVK